MKIAFDFDGTLSLGWQLNPVVAAILDAVIRAGHECCVITSRDPSHESPHWFLQWEVDRVPVVEFLQKHQIAMPIHFTKHQPKFQTMRRLGVYRLYDNDIAEVESARRDGLQAVLVDGLSVGVGRCRVCLEDWSIVGTHGGISCGLCGSGIA